MQELFILGAADNEMQLITEMLTSANRPFAFAQSLAEDKRANAAECAQGKWRADIPDDVGRVVLVELAPSECVAGREVLLIDHHAPHHPPFPALYQVATYLMLGERGLILGACDHDLARAYTYFPAEKVLAYRAEIMNASLEDALRYYETLLPTRIPNLRLGLEPSPNALIGDVLISKGEAGLVVISNPNITLTRFAIVGATTPKLVEQVLQPFRDAGYETYATRAVGGVYLPEPNIALQLLGA